RSRRHEERLRTGWMTRLLLWLVSGPGPNGASCHGWEWAGRGWEGGPGAAGPRPGLWERLLDRESLNDINWMSRSKYPEKESALDLPDRRVRVAGGRLPGRRPGDAPHHTADRRGDARPAGISLQGDAKPQPGRAGRVAARAARRLHAEPAAGRV